MEQPPPPPPTSGAGGEAEDPFDDYDDIVIPPDYLLELDVDGRAVEDDVKVGGASGGGEEDDDRLSLAYKGLSYVFDSVPPQKVVSILSLLNGFDIAPLSARPQPTHLVQPIIVPQDFDRTAAVSRYREKRKTTLRFDVKADYSIRREIASRIARKRGKFVSSDKKLVDNSVAATASARRQQGEEKTELQFCDNCRASSPNGFCNACGLKTKEIRDLTGPARGGYGGR